MFEQEIIYNLIEDIFALPLRLHKIKAHFDYVIWNL